MPISRIQRIRNHRIFRGFEWPDDLHRFAQFNLIYGWNGSGKTTLASLLSHLQRRTPLTEGEALFDMGDAGTVSGDLLATAVLPEVRVFNRDFIEATIDAAKDTMAPIFYLGADSVEKQRRIGELREELQGVSGDIARETTLKTAADNALDDFCVDQGKLVKQFLTSPRLTTYNNYDKRAFRLSVSRLTSETYSGLLLNDAQKEALLQKKNAEPMDAVQRVPYSPGSLKELTDKVQALISESVVSQTLDELASDRDLGAWVQHGLELHSKNHHTDTCRFCGSVLEPSRRAALEGHFNDAFVSFQGKIGNELAALSGYKSRLEGLRFPDETRLYKHLSSDFAANVRTAEDTLKLMLSYVARLETALAQKKDAPFTHIEWSEDCPDTAELSSAVDAVTSVIDKHNEITTEFRRELQNACSSLERAYIAEAFVAFDQKRTTAETRGATVLRLTGQSQGLEKEITDLERDILEHQRPAEELNGELRSYLGHGELTLDVKDTGYVMMRAGKPATHLSEGEKTALAFLYFLKSLQGKEFDMANSIIVIDDPVSSLDASALFSAFGYMQDRVKDAGQLFVLTHNFAFFRQVKNWFHNLPNQRKPDLTKRPARFYLLVCATVNGSRSAALKRLDPLLEEYESEYHYLFKTIHDESECARANIVLERLYGMPNAARRLLETFLAFRYPDAGNLHQRLERVDFAKERKVRILRLLHTYSHADGIAEPEHDPTLLAETPEVLKDVLALIQACDPAHYEAMLKVISDDEEE